MLAKIEYDNIFSLPLVKRKILRAVKKGHKRDEEWNFGNGSITLRKSSPINNHNSALKRLIHFIDCLRMAILRPPRI